jgi:hypothetical protein
VINADGAGGLRPFKAFARAAPMTDQIAGLIEFENMRGRDAAAGRRIEYRALFVIAE